MSKKWKSTHNYDCGSLKPPFLRHPVYFCIKIYRVVCPNFEHPALTSSFKKYNFLHVKNSVQTIVYRLSVLKLLSFRMVILLFSAYSIYRVHQPKLTRLGQGGEVRATRHIMYILYVQLWKGRGNLLFPLPWQYQMDTQNRSNAK